MSSTTESAVLDAAGQCFARYGFKKTSMDDVAGEARVAKGTVYLYCDSKQDLFYRTVERELRAWVEELSSIIDPSVPATDVLAAMATRDAAFVEDRPLVAGLLSGVIDGDVPAYEAEFAELRRVGLSHVVAVLRLGIEQGIFSPELDVEPTARILQEMQVTGALLRHRGALTVRQVRRQQAAALRLVLDGLRSR